MRNCVVCGEKIEVIYRAYKTTYVTCLNCEVEKEFSPSKEYPTYQPPARYYVTPAVPITPLVRK